MDSRKTYFVLSMLWTGVIFLSSTGLASSLAEAFYDAGINALHLSSSHKLHFVVEKIFHVFLFFVLGWLFSPVPTGRKRTRTLVSILCCFVVGFLSELLQSLFPGREPRVSDVLINGLSGTASSLLRICS